MGQIDFDDSSFRIIHPKHGEFRINWDRIVRIVAMKRDLLTTDLICFQIFYEDNDVERVMETNEEMAGFVKNLGNSKNDRSELAGAPQSLRVFEQTLSNAR
jgi:hypothetical protein